MLSIVYISSAVQLFSEAELRDLLQISRENNAKLDITGMLLYKGGNFMQVIEGPDEAIQALYKKISRDPRHDGLIVLSQESISERQFPNWSMGFQNLDTLSPQDLPGFTDFLEADFLDESFRANPRRAYVMLLNFKKHMR